MSNLKERIQAFCIRAEQIKEESDKLSGFTCWKTLRIPDYISDKWCRIITREIDPDGKVLRSSSVYAFIALKDFTNKGLGQVKAGDIHKAASWAAPAKHARGNVFQEDFNGCIQPFSIVYLRG